MIKSQKQSLEMKAGQSLVMTANLQQSIQLLQLSSLELNAFVAEELEKNPLLSSSEEQDNDNSTEALPRDSLSYHHISKYSSMATGDADNHTNEKTLRQHVLEQIYLDIPCPTKQMIAFNLADALNDNGYIETDLAHLTQQIGCLPEILTQTLELVQSFDPPGIFARDLAECLALQLKDKGLYTKQFELLLANLNLLATGKTSDLMVLCLVSKDQLLQMVKTIRSLNPKPGSIFANDSTSYLVPEVFVKREKNKLIVELNNEILPKLLVNRRYYAEIRKKTTNQSEQKYLSEQLYTANWLIKALDQRAQTILKTATEIASSQHEFFEKGIMYLKPMTLKNIAEKLGLHESTISRVTTNKFMSTPCGLFEMKYFFSSKLDSSFGDDCSSTTVKHVIKELIDKEEKTLSDQAIVAILAAKGMHLARRTVAKYREEMHISSSATRKAEKALQVAL